MSEKKLTRNQLIGLLNELSSEQLEEVIAGVVSIQEARRTPVISEEQQHAELSDARHPSNSNSRGGYYELKTINNHRYWYLRQWSNGKHKSIYIGKILPHGS